MDIDTSGFGASEWAGHCDNLSSALESANERIQKLDRRHDLLLSAFYYEMARYAAHRWEKDVRHRPEVNVYRAGMDKAWKTLESHCLERREEIAAAMSGSSGGGNG